MTASTLRSALLLGVLVSLVQLAACLLSSGHSSLPKAYQGLSQWDSTWYENIAQMGYKSTIPPLKWKRDLANVAFFPGYPILSRIVANLFELRMKIALLVTAQVFAVFFWTLFFLFLLQQTRSPLTVASLTLAVFAHPAAFYLQAGYSESLFLSALLAFIFASTRQPFSPGLAIGSGIAMTATRIVGAPLAFLGAIQSFLDCVLFRRPRQARKNLRRQLLVGTFSLVGIGSFFLFCQMRFGHWNLYMQTQAIGWDIKPNYLAIFSPRSWFNWSLSDWRPWDVNPNEVSRVATSFYLTLLLSTGVLEWLAWRIGTRGLRARLPFYLASLLMLYISVSGLASVGYLSMVRYTFPVHVCWLLGFFTLLQALPPKFQAATKTRYATVRYAMMALASLIIVYSLLMQKYFIELYTHGKWVA